MNIKNIVEKYVGVHSHVEQGEQYFYTCPKCGSSRFTINYNKNKFKCWKCKYSSLSIISLLYEYKASRDHISTAKKLLGIQDHYRDRDKSLQDKLDQIFYSEEKTKQIFTPKSWVSIKDPSLIVREARKYLKSRGVSNYEMTYYDIKFDTKDGMIVFPSYDIHNNLNFYVKRNVGNKYSYYQNCRDVKKTEIVFWESLIDFERPITLTEGIFDGINIGDNTVLILGSILPNRLFKLILAYETPLVTVFLDKDAEDSMLKMSEKLFNAGINTERVFLKSDTDAGELSRSHVKLYLNNTKKLDKFSIIEQNLASI